MDNKNTQTRTERIKWLSIVRAITIVLVVINHVRLLNIATGENYVFVDEFRWLFKYLRMPTFIFVSGALLYLTRIRKNWLTGALYRDKLIRIGLPLIFCTILGCFSQMLFNGFVKHPKEVDLSTFFYSFVDYNTTPWPHRWYLATLLEMMALYPVFRFLCNKRAIYPISVFILLSVLYMFDFSQYTDSEYFFIFTNRYLPFFFAGIMTFRYEWWKYLDKVYMPFLSFGGYFLVSLTCNSCDIVNYVLGLLGICSMLSTSMLIAKITPELFSSFRNYIYQIYLFGVVFQAFVELILWRRAGCPDQYVYVFYVLNVLCGIYVPVALCKVVEKIPSRFIRLCFGLGK